MLSKEKEQSILEEKEEILPNRFHYLASKGDIDLFKQGIHEWAIEKGHTLIWDGETRLPDFVLPYLNGCDKGRNIPLHWAAHGRKVDMAEKMIQWGADPSFPNLAGLTPLEQLWSRGGNMGCSLVRECIENKLVPVSLVGVKDSWFKKLLINLPNSIDNFEKIANDFFKLGVDFNESEQDIYLDDEKNIFKIEMPEIFKEHVHICFTRFRLLKLPESPTLKKNIRL